MKLGEIQPSMETLGHGNSDVEDIIDINREDSSKDIEPAAGPAGLEVDDVELLPGQTEAERDAVMEEKLQTVDEEVEAVTAGPKSVQDYFTVADQLDELQNSAQEAVASDSTLTKAGAVAVQASLESIMSSLGLKAPARVTLEAFSGRWSQQDATSLTMEGIFSAVKAVGAKILEAIKGAWSIASNFLSNILKNRTLLGVYLKSLQKKVADKGTWVIDKPSLATKVAHTLQVGGVSDVNSTVSILNNSVRLMDAYDDATDIIKKVRDGKLAGDPIAAFYQTMGANAGWSVGSATINDQDVDLYLALPSAMSIAFVQEHGLTELRYYTNQNGHPRNDEIAALTPYSMASVLKRAQSALDALWKAESRTNTLRDAISGILRRFEMEYSRLRSAMGSDTHSQKLAINRQGRAIEKTITKVVARFPAMVFTAIRSACEYVSLSLKNLKEA